ncbi:MAG: tetratricopeptide repeat protein [Desulfovibrionaceae bacterium]|nr:tetratricopeptide repeat protein [Desulfovibrionaceae bacterium]
MPDDPRTFSMRYRFHFLLVLALLPCLISNSCSPKTPGLPGVSAKELSQRAAADYYYLIYQDLLRSGERDQAATVLATLAKLTPTPQVLLELANLYWGINQRDAAIAVLEDAARRHPEEKQIAFYLASAYQMQRRRDEAVAVVAGYLAAHPDDLDAHQEMSTLLIDAGKFREALESLKKIEASAPSPTVSFYMAKAHVGLGDRPAAIAALRRVLEADRTMVAAWAELGFLQEQEKDYRGAVESYAAILELGEEGPEVWSRLVRLHLRLKSPAKAMALMDKAPKDSGFVLETLSAFIAEGYAAEAGKLLDRLEKGASPSPDILFYRAVVAYEGEKKPAKAIGYLKRVPESHPHYDKSLGFRIQLLLEMDRPAEALELARESAGRFPDKKEFRLLHAVALERTGDPDGAAAVLTEAGEKWAEDTEILYRLGVVLERQDRTAESVRVMEQVIALDGEHADALNFVGYTLADDNRDLPRALELIEKAVGIEPDNPYFLDSLAWVHYRMGDLDKAWEIIRQAVSQPVGDPVIWEHYGDIAAAMGKKAEAAEAYGKAIADNPAKAADIRRKKDAL